MLQIGLGYTESIFMKCRINKFSNGKLGHIDKRKLDMAMCKMRPAMNQNLYVLRPDS